MASSLHRWINAQEVIKTDKFLIASTSKKKSGGVELCMWRQILPWRWRTILRVVNERNADASEVSLTRDSPFRVRLTPNSPAAGKKKKTSYLFFCIASNFTDSDQAGCCCYGGGGWWWGGGTRFNSLISPSFFYILCGNVFISFQLITLLLSVRPLKTNLFTSWNDRGANPTPLSIHGIFNHQPPPKKKLYFCGLFFFVPLPYLPRESKHRISILLT
jgi:hypothetical protein